MICNLYGYIAVLATYGVTDVQKARALATQRPRAGIWRDFYLDVYTILNLI